MIAIDVEFLTGRYAATSFADRDKPEWPPHPARLFSALVATLNEHEELADAGRRALEWLEAQQAPEILASSANPRLVLKTYVPENDVRVLGDWTAHEQQLQTAMRALSESEQSGDAKAIQRARKAIEKAEARLAEQLVKATRAEISYNSSTAAKARKMLPEHRGRQERKLPSVTPDQPRVRYVWPDAVADGDTGGALTELARRLVRLGHSSTLVACRFVDVDSGESAQMRGLNLWIPTADGTEMMRTVTAGQFGRLARAYKRHQGVEPRVLPAQHQPYRRPGGVVAVQPARSVFGEWFVLREIAPESGRRLGLMLPRTEDITRALRGALLHHAENPSLAVLSGHAPDGTPMERPHAAYVPLPDVGSGYSSGAVLGAAIVIPRDLDPADRNAVLRAIGRWEHDGLRLLLGRAGAMLLERVVDGDPRTTLDPSAWMRPSRRWASVTPVALDENPGDLSARDPEVAAAAASRAEEIVSRSCERIRLPRPAWVQVMRRSLFDAAPEAQRFMPFPRHGRGPRRVCVHVELCFAEPVTGPVLLGSGRFFGLGLCRPQREGWS